MGEVVGALGEGAGDHDRGFDAPARQLAGIADGDRIHGGLRREVRCEIWRRAAAMAAAADPQYQAAALLAQVWQCSAVHALRAEHIDVEELCVLLRRERPE